LRTLFQHCKDEMIQDSGKLVGRGSNRCWRAESSSHAPKVVAEIRPTCVQRLSAQAKSDCKSTHDVTRACVQNLSSANSVVRTKTEPGGESRSIGEFRKISADLGQKHVRR